MVRGFGENTIGRLEIIVPKEKIAEVFIGVGHKVRRSLLLVQMTSEDQNNQMDKLTCLMEPALSPLPLVPWLLYLMAHGRSSLWHGCRLHMGSLL